MVEGTYSCALLEGYLRQEEQSCRPSRQRPAYLLEETSKWNGRGADRDWRGLKLETKQEVGYGGPVQWARISRYRLWKRM